MKTLIYGRESLKIDEIKSALLSHEKMEHDSDDRDDAASSVVARGNWEDVGSRSSRGKFRFESRYHEGRCKYYKKEGHQKVDCPKLKNKKATDLRDQASVAEGVENVLSVSTSLVGDAWILDSSYSYHICPNRDWFTSYQTINGGSVLMRNNTSCKIAGIGTVKIKSYDGTMKTLSNVPYIPGSKKNLISLGIFAKGYKCSTKGGVLKVSKGDLVVIKGRLVNDLYLLQGSTVISATSASSSSNLDTTLVSYK